MPSNNANGFHIEDVERVLSQADAVQAPEPKHRTGPAVAIANTMGRKAIANAQAEFIRDVLTKLIELLYDMDDFGRYWNLAADGRIDKKSIQMPWTPQGQKAWNVTPTHAHVLRYTLIHKLHRSPFVYGSDTMWYIDLDNYPDKENALYWLKRAEIDGDMWNQLIDQWKATQPKKKRKKKPKKNK